MKHTIEVNGIKIYAHHGCLAEETKIGGHYEVDVQITTVFSKATTSDSIDDTICYVAINKIVCDEMAKPSKLIEHVGQRIVNRLKSEIPAIQSSRIKVIKHSPPINGDVKNVAIIIEEDHQ